MRIIFTIFFLFGPPATAKTLAKTFAKPTTITQQHREHGAHEHGHGTIAMAFEGVTGTIELKATAEAIVGFEYLPKSDKDKKKEQAAYSLIESNIGKIIQFESALGCEMMREKIETTRSGEHADTTAIFKVICAKTPFGSTLTLENKTFPNLKDIDVTILVGDLQKSAELGQKKITVELK